MVGPEVRLGHAGCQVARTSHPSDGGQISYRQLADRVAVTYEDVPEFVMYNANNIQVELFFEGTIRITYLGVDALFGIAGLSPGTGVPGDFEASGPAETRPRKSLLSLTEIYRVFAIYQSFLQIGRMQGGTRDSSKHIGRQSNAG